VVQVRLDLIERERQRAQRLHLLRALTTPGDSRREVRSHGLPVSTTHVLASGVAGTVAANGSGLQWTTVRKLLLAWVLTLPASIARSATLHWVFHQLF
jgi:hypothetical protein